MEKAAPSAASVAVADDMRRPRLATTATVSTEGSNRNTNWNRIRKTEKLVKTSDATLAATAFATASRPKTRSCAPWGYGVHTLVSPRAAATVVACDSHSMY